MKLGKLFTKRLLPKLVKLLKWLEKFSSPRLTWVFKGRTSDAIIGLIVAILAASTITVPPFSGLDTLPALGIVVIAAGIILKDGVMAIAGLTIGIGGIIIQLLLGKAVIDLIQKVF